MAQVNINISMDENLRNDFENLCGDLGLTITESFNMFAKAAVRQQRIPFEIIPNAETIAALEELEQMKKDAALGKGYTDVDRMMKELLA